MDKVSEFNEFDWRCECDLIAKESSKRCGLSHTVYVDKFSSAIDSVLCHLSAEAKNAFIDIAREWDYGTPEERYEEQVSLKEQGYCSHGLEFDCCPAGCGEE
jgi:hypothetical protein